MKSNSRTSKSIKNSIIALLFFSINLILQFFSRKIFIECLGTEIIGLNTTVSNILQFLNLAEMGIGAAVGFTLYKPLFEEDTKSINDIITLQGYLYRRIAFIIIFGSVILMCFFPIIFKNMELPLWYAYASFCVLLFSSLLGYFCNYKQVLLTASQQDFKLQVSYKSIIFAKIIFQIFFISFYSNGYIWWLVMEFLFAIIAAISLSLMITKSFPVIKKSELSYADLRNKYSVLTLKIRQALFHKIGGFALSQMSPLVIYAFTSLTVVTLYSNYLLITSGIISLFTAMFNSIGAGIGNLVAEGNKSRITKVFYEIFNFRFFLVSVLCFATYNLTPEFVILWIGPQYVLPQSTLLIMISIMYISITRNTVDSYLFAYGMLQDIYAPIIETFLNLGFSILFGYYWQLNGILLGVLVSQIIVIKIWKPYFLFSSQFSGGMKFYYKNYIYLITIALLIAAVTKIILNHINYTIQNAVFHFIINAILTISIYSSVLFLVLYNVNNDFKNITTKILNYKMFT